jgi:hypothetical protein
VTIERRILERRIEQRVAETLANYAGVSSDEEQHLVAETFEGLTAHRIFTLLQSVAPPEELRFGVALQFMTAGSNKTSTDHLTLAEGAGALLLALRAFLTNPDISKLNDVISAGAFKGDLGLVKRLIKQDPMSALQYMAQAVPSGVLWGLVAAGALNTGATALGTKRGTGPVKEPGLWDAAESEMEVPE